MASAAASGPVAASAVAAASACAGRAASAAAARRLGLELGGACAAALRLPRRPLFRLTRPASRPAQTAVEWPPPAAPPWATQDAQQAYAHAGFWPPPGGDAGAYDDGDDANAYEDEDDEPYEEEAYDEGAFAAAGEVIWRVGDTLDDEDDEDEDETPEVVLELSDEWAARFALTEHRRAQRTPFCATAALSVRPHNRLTRRAGRSALRRQAAGASREPARRAGARRAAEQRHACCRPGGTAAHGRGHRARGGHRRVAAQRRCVALIVLHTFAMPRRCADVMR